MAPGGSFVNAKETPKRRLNSETYRFLLALKLFCNVLLKDCRQRTLKNIFYFGNKTVKMSSDTIRFHFYDVYIFEKLPHKFEWTICRNFFNYTSMKNNIKCLLYCFILFDIVVHVTRGQFYDTSYTSYKSKKILYEKFFALALFYLFTNRTTVSCYPVRYPKDWMELYFLLLNQNRCKIKFGSVSKLGLRYVKNWPYWEEYVEE